MIYTLKSMKKTQEGMGHKQVIRDLKIVVIKFILITMMHTSMILEMRPIMIILQIIGWI
jgi:hypothetical protein